MNYLIDFIVGNLWTLITILLIVYAIKTIKLKSNYNDYKKREYRHSKSSYEPNSDFSNQSKEYDYSYSYQYKPLFSNNESRAYKKLKTMTDELDLMLFAKVRLFDLLEPRPGTKNYKGAMWKIQAKHVDFVVCDKELNAIAVIELDDSSHDRVDRVERDKFVNTVLMNNGYKIIHVRYLTDAELESIKDFLQQK